MNIADSREPALARTDEKRRCWFGRFAPILTLTAICWLVFLGDQLLWGGHLTRYGIMPRRIGSLPGIIWAPFLHTSMKHLLANTLPLLVLGGILCARGKAEFRFITLAGILGGGALTWLFGRTAVHVGASGLVFCFFGYLAALAFFNRNIITLLISGFCVLAYGGVLRGILPTSAPVSWEGHLAGLLAGIALAWLISKVKNLPDDTARP